MMIVQNPILPGFHPDPCICRVGNEYFLATSTFEWWPGVRIHRSVDLVRWKHAGYALTRRSQLDLRGNPPSGGVWAPSLTHADGLFWLVYSDVKSFNGPFKDVTNFLVTSPSIDGLWSDPVVLNHSGFDPSLFHDNDGTKWLLNQLWDHRPGAPSPFAGILLQRFDPASRTLVGEPELIYRGSSLGVTEGPQLLQKDGWYYLITAEGGTGLNHAATVARSRSLHGPYELSPHHPLLTSVGAPPDTLQKAGHASFFQAADGAWYMAHLGARPIGPHRRCLLGRETALQALAWTDDGWPILRDGGNHPHPTVEIPGSGAPPEPKQDFHDDFDSPYPGPEWNTLREPVEPAWLSLTEAPGHLRLRGRHSLTSLHNVSLTAVRLTRHRGTVTTRLRLDPPSWQQRAGLALYYNHQHFLALELAGPSAGAVHRTLRVWKSDLGRCEMPTAWEAEVPSPGPVELRGQWDYERLQFFWRPDGGDWHIIGPELDPTILSDERIRDSGGHGFTGTFAALYASDSGDRHFPADFDWLRIE